MSKSWRAYAEHILDAIARIERIRKRGDLTRDEILYDASLRNLQTLSEATQRLPETLKLAYPVIPWQRISGFRNILVHAYLGEIDARTVQKERGRAASACTESSCRGDAGRDTATRIGRRVIHGWISRVAWRCARLARQSVD